MSQRILLILLSASLGCLAHAGVYKVVDEKGNVHFTDQPPPSKDGKPKEMKIRTTSGVQPVTASSAPIDADAGMKAEKAAVDAENAKIKEKNCKISQANLTMMQRGGKMRTVTDDGQIKVLDSQGKQAELARAQADVDKWCTK